jgi:hypothetical protein
MIVKDSPSFWRPIFFPILTSPRHNRLRPGLTCHALV